MKSTVVILLLIMTTLGCIDNAKQINSTHPIQSTHTASSNISTTSTPLEENIKTMTIGDSLDIRPGYSFKVASVDAHQGQGFVLLTVYKNGVLLYEKSLYNGDYFQLESENNDIIFKARIANVYAGTMSDMVDIELPYSITNQTVTSIQLI